MPKPPKSFGKKPAKKQKADKKPRKVRASKPDGKPAAIVAGSNTLDRNKQALARTHRDQYVKTAEAQKKANRAMTKLKKLIKDDGLNVSQIKIMVDLMTPEGEAAFKASIASSLQAAQWQGAEVGNQLDLFREPDRTPAVDQAYEFGVQDCMDGKTAKSPFDPSLPQSQSYLKGYHDETERRVTAGIKKTEPKDDKPRGETLAAARAANEVPSPPADKFN